MKIIDLTGTSKGPYLSVKKAEYVDDYSLRITFNDGTTRVVDFGPFLRACPHPDVKKFLDVKRFKTFHIEHGTLMWGDFDMIFPMIELYEGEIEYLPPKTDGLFPKASNGRSAIENGAAYGRKSKSIPSERRKKSGRKKESSPV